MERLLAGQWGQALLPEYVFLELTTVLAARCGLSISTNAGETLLNARELELVPCSDLFLNAFETFRCQESAALSFVDAAIVCVARSRGAEHIATFDSDFLDIPGLSVVP